MITRMSTTNAKASVMKFLDSFVPKTFPRGHRQRNLGFGEQGSKRPICEEDQAIEGYHVVKYFSLVAPANQMNWSFIWNS